MPQSYVDVSIVKTKMGKRLDFEAATKNAAEINRKNKGDSWLAYQVIYGETNTVYFVSTPANYDAAEGAVKAFEGSITKVLGAAGMQKLFNDWDASTDSARSEFRRRRWDLTTNPRRTLPPTTV